MSGTWRPQVQTRRSAAMEKKAVESARPETGRTTIQLELFKVFFGQALHSSTRKMTCVLMCITSCFGLEQHIAPYSLGSCGKKPSLLVSMKRSAGGLASHEDIHIRTHVILRVLLCRAVRRCRQTNHLLVQSMSNRTPEPLVAPVFNDRPDRTFGAPDFLADDRVEPDNERSHYYCPGDKSPGEHCRPSSSRRAEAHGTHALQVSGRFCCIS